MEYFAIINGAQAGPMSKAQLALAGITPETMVWRQGLQDWVKAETLPDLNDVFMEDSAFGGYARPEEQLNPYACEDRDRQETPVAPASYNNYGQPKRPNPYNPYGNGGQPIAHTNWMPWAIVGTILGTIFSCVGMIFGIIGIVKANKANEFYQNGLGAEGDVANSSAKVMTILALVLGGVGLIMMMTGATTKLLQFAMNPL